MRQLWGAPGHHQTSLINIMMPLAYCILHDLAAFLGRSCSTSRPVRFKVHDWMTQHSAWHVEQHHPVEGGCRKHVEHWTRPVGRDIVGEDRCALRCNGRSFSAAGSRWIDQAKCPRCKRELGKNQCWLKFTAHLSAWGTSLQPHVLLWHSCETKACIELRSLAIPRW